MLRTSGLGFLANVLVLLTFILILYLGLTVLGLVGTVDEFARAEKSGELPTDRSALEVFGESVVASAQNALKVLWDARLGFVVLGVLGVFMAWADQIGLRAHSGRAGAGSLICLAVILAVSIITFVVSERGEFAAWMAESPEMYRWRDFLMGTYGFDAVVGLIVALTLTYPIWAVWRWWYVRLTGWLTPVRVGPVDIAPGVGASWPQSFWQGRQLVKLLAPLLLLCVILLYPVNRYHDEVAVQLQHGRAFAEISTRPHVEFVVTVAPEVRKIRVVNINGQGTVDLHVSRSTDYTEAVKSVTGWAFERRVSTSEHYYADIPMDGVEPGDYYLHIVQQDGWGSYEYALSSGGGPLSSASALASGFLLACSIVLGLALILLLVGRFLGWPMWEGQNGVRAASGSTA